MRHTYHRDAFPMTRAERWQSQLIHFGAEVFPRMTATAGGIIAAFIMVDALAAWWTA